MAFWQSCEAVTIDFDFSDVSREMFERLFSIHAQDSALNNATATRIKIMAEPFCALSFLENESIEGDYTRICAGGKLKNKPAICPIVCKYGANRGSGDGAFTRLRG